MAERKFVIQGKSGTVSGPEGHPFMKFLAKNAPEKEVPVNIDISTVDFILSKLRERADEEEAASGPLTRGIITAWNLVHSLKVV